MKRTGVSAVEKAKAAIGNLTPLKGHNCGELCSAACCKGDSETGMRLFPGEDTVLDTVELPDGGRLAVCNGKCNREERPLSCMIFPFFPTVDEKGRVYAEIDPRAMGICPLAANCDVVKFDKAFIKAVKKAGKYLAKDESCLEFLRSVTEEIDEINALNDVLGFKRSGDEAKIDEKTIEEAIARINRMETLYDAVSEALMRTPEKLSSPELAEIIGILSDYVSSGTWLIDYELDEQHLLPIQLKRGVLSQDGLYNLLCDLTEMGIIGKNEI